MIIKIKKYLKKLFIAITFNCILFTSFYGQKITFYHDVFPIIQKNCSPCHSKNSSAPFGLLTYKDVAPRARQIQKVIDSGVMPPWPADAGYQSFQNERILSEKEKKLIGNWIGSGMKKGVPNLFKKKENHSKSKDSKPEIILMVPDSFIVNKSLKDQFARFYFPNLVENDIEIGSFKFYSGNPEIVHHMEIWNCVPDSNAFEPGLKNPKIEIKDDLALTSHLTQTDNFISGILPGNLEESYPEGISVLLPKNSVMLALIHYAPVLTENKIQSKILLYKSKNPALRYAQTISILNNKDKMLNGPLFIPANSIKEFHSVKVIEADFSAFAVMPHAHQLCKNFFSFAINPEGDTIPIVRINSWNFQWQFLYRFKEFKVFPAGTEIHVMATYDNTSNNFQNPFNPPRDVGTSNRAQDEMMALFLIGVPFKSGDRGKILNYGQ